ncbi:hypothetical protein [Lysinibacillus odysseyi]|uniref:Uncharacterized protein n=2 Tax=Bacillaceae TaxID=186817 RepID=A0A0A3IR42_9BACI|nr:hypothetical protein [Lysinibacillus odysseyi]KGR85313.1 hypothetical protein CD32_08695 [Lysinibacillus odysseyi 34hs-1 = NBRC 100172]
MQEVVSKEELTYEGMRKVLGGNGPGGLAPYAMAAYDFFAGDIRTILDPEATVVKKAMAIRFTFFKPAKLLDKAGDVIGAARDAGKAVDNVTDNSVVSVSRQPVQIIQNRYLNEIQQGRALDMFWRMVKLRLEIELKKLTSS